MKTAKVYNCFNVGLSLIFYLGYVLYIFKAADCMDIRLAGKHERNLRKENANRFVSMQAACTRNIIMVVTTLRDPFNGLVYAMGYPSACVASGNGTKEIKLSMNVSQCGVRIFEETNSELVYELYVYIQFDATIQKISDEQVLVSCRPVEYMSVTSQGRSAPSSNSEWTPLREHGPKALALEMPSSSSSLKIEVEEEGETSHSLINAWMDILNGNQANGKMSRDILRIGEEATMLIKIYQQPGLTTRVVNCVAHDGAGENQQELIDSNGCTVEDSIMPNLREKTVKRTGLKLVYAPFSAFKFPEKEHLHLKCQIMVCIRSCPSKLPCSLRSGRKYPPRQYSVETIMEMYKKEDSVIDIIDVFNAFEVRAPQIEIDLNDRHDELKSVVTKTRQFEENTTCLPTSRLVLSFGILTGITIIAMVFSFSMLAWSRRQKSLRKKCIQLQCSRPYESYT